MREADRDRFKSLADLGGRKVATLSGTIAADILGRTAGVIATPYDDDVHPYSDCLLYTSPSPRDRTRSRMPSSA